MPVLGGGSLGRNGGGYSRVSPQRGPVGGCGGGDPRIHSPIGASPVCAAWVRRGQGPSAVPPPTFLPWLHPLGILVLKGGGTLSSLPRPRCSIRAEPCRWRGTGGASQFFLLRASSIVDLAAQAPNNHMTKVGGAPSSPISPRRPIRNEGGFLALPDSPLSQTQDWGVQVRQRALQILLPPMCGGGGSQPPQNVPWLSGGFTPQFSAPFLNGPQALLVPPLQGAGERGTLHRCQYEKSRVQAPFKNCPAN